jgi:RNA polymerase sigma-70 factor (ECF subfamily)
VTLAPIKDSDGLIPTRQSLLSRLKDWNDQESWKVFFDTYWKLIYRTALKAGLSDAEAQDVVQETVISVSRSIPNFRYDPEKGSFNSWLLKVTTRRIADQLQKRGPVAKRAGTATGTSTGTSTIDRIPDPAASGLEELWDEEWEQNLIDAATQRVKNRVDAKHYQIFDCYAVKQWPISRVAQTFKVNRAKVYVIKHRVSRMIKNEIQRLRAKPL